MQVRILCGIMLGSWIAAVSFATPAPSVFSQHSMDRVATVINQPQANTTQKPLTANVAIVNPIPPALAVHGYYLQDAQSGQVLASMNADQRMAPASLTKLMTLYLTFAALQANRVHLTDLVPISENAWKTGGSRMFVKVGDRVPLSQLIQGVIVDSGNDACMALSEYIGGTEQNFVNLMNAQAQLLNMKNTHYKDCTGLPDPNHYTTPQDIAKLTRALINNFPANYHFFDEKTLTYNNITQPNRNRLLWLMPSVDGLKTGHTEEAGYCLVASAKQNDLRLISVLLGASTEQDRVQYSETLLNYGFRFFKAHQIYKANMPIEQIPVYFGKSATVPIGVAQDFYLTVPAGQYAQVITTLKINAPLSAPLTVGQTVGEVTALLDKKVLATAPLVALAPITSANVFGRTWDHLRLWMSKR